MNLLWITGRRLNSDLASRTELSLAKSLTELGINITILSPSRGEIKKIKKIEFVSLKEIRIKGLRTISGGLSIKSILKQINDTFDYALVDWRMVQFSHKILKIKNIPWSLIDRGPPTFNGLLPFIQRIQWKNSWNKANNNTDVAFVVSDLHADYVTKRTKFDKKMISLPAGVDKKWITKVERRFSRNINFCYLGSLDANRGVKEITKLAENLAMEYGGGKVIVMGDGDCREYFLNVSSRYANLEYHGNITDKRELQNILEECHVGIMPMPDIEIWNIASSIKLPEYLSKGMLIVGVNHPGNYYGNEECFQLSDKDWAEDSVRKIIEIEERGHWGKISKISTETAKKMTWEQTAKKIIDEIVR